MNSSKRLRLMAVSAVTAAVAAVAGPALAVPAFAAQPTGQVALVNPPTRGGHEPTFADCGSDHAPGSFDRISQHAEQRMKDRDVSEDELRNAVRINAKDAWCQTNGNWHYSLGMAGGQLEVIIGANRGQWVVVTVFWKGEPNI
ncbi:DUF4258 domain-containing protein [Kitasatospora sp. NPDC001683]